jgi:hypothetical protein
MALSTVINGNERRALWMCLALACATPALGGCSFMLSSGPPSHTDLSAADEPIKCSSSKLPPIVDTLLGVGELGRIALAAATNEREYRDSPISKEADILLGVAFASLFIASAVYGYTVTGNCDEAKLRWVQSRDAAPRESERAFAFAFADKPPPVTAAGFELGKAVALAEERCTGAGHTWQALEDGELSCSSAPVDLGVPVTVKLAACAGVVCNVVVNASDGAPWSALVPRFGQLSQLLEKEVGASHQRETKAINGCADSMSDCFAAGRVRTSVTWRWPNKEVVSLVLDGGPPGGAPVLGVFYGTAALAPGGFAEPSLINQDFNRASPRGAAASFQSPTPS